MSWTEEQYKQHLERRSKPVSKPKQTATSKMQALGRLPKGHMNKTESTFAQYLDMEKLANKVLWYKFEGIKLMLAANTSITKSCTTVPNPLPHNGSLNSICPPHSPGDNYTAQAITTII